MIRDEFWLRSKENMRLHYADEIEAVEKAGSVSVIPLYVRRALYRYGLIPVPSTYGRGNRR